MPIVAPTYSVKPYTPQVHHNNSRCTERNNIEPQNVRHGTGGRPLCKRCADLNRQRL
jgi:hypothetical protein